MRVVESQAIAEKLGRVRWIQRSRARPGLMVPSLAGAGPLLFAALLYLGLLIALLRSYDFNPTGPIRLGDQFAGQRFWTESTIVQHGIGYDGQFFFYLANDPLLQTDHPESLIAPPAYRYGRILYPAVVWALSLGQLAIVPWALLGVNLAAALVGTWAASGILRALGANRWLALGFSVSPAIVIGLIADLAEPLAYALIATGILLYLRRRHRLAGLALALATLTREASAIVALGFALHAVARRAWREALAYLSPLALPAGWHLLVWARLGSLPSAQSPENYSLPLSGPLYRAGLLLGLQAPLLGEPPTPPDQVPLELTIIALSVTLMLLGLTRIARHRNVFGLQLWLQAAAALCTSPLVWIGLGSYARVLGLLYLFYGLALAADKSTAHAPRAGCRDRAGPKLQSIDERIDR